MASSPLEVQDAMSPAPTKIAGLTTSWAVAPAPAALAETVADPVRLPTTRPVVVSTWAIVVSDSVQRGLSLVNAGP